MALKDKKAVVMKNAKQRPTLKMFTVPQVFPSPELLASACPEQTRAVAGREFFYNPFNIKCNAKDAIWRTEQTEQYGRGGCGRQEKEAIYFL